MLFSIAADNPQVLKDAGDDLAEHLGRQGMTVTAQYDGSVIISDDGHTREHFGFRDGIAQPGIEGIADRQQGGLRRRIDTVPADRFVIGVGENSAAAGLDHRGSYMIFAQIEQFVDRFEEFCAESALRINADWGRDDVTPEAVAALMIGRYQDGTPVDLQTVPEEPKVGGGDLNDFTYDKDPYGRACPLGAHIRKMNPRTSKVGDAHRILRRGVPYESEGEKGLLFVCYQASLAAGFEYLQGRWANALISSAETRLDGRLNERVARRESLLGVNFHLLAREARALPIDAPPDPLVGLPGRAGTASFELPRSGGRGRLDGPPTVQRLGPLQNRRLLLHTIGEHSPAVGWWMRPRSDVQSVTVYEPAEQLLPRLSDRRPLTNTSDTHEPTQKRCSVKPKVSLSAPAADWRES